MTMKDGDIVDLWSIKYALTQGIQFRKGYEITGEYAYGKPSERCFGGEQLKPGSNAFFTEADAKVAAINMAERKIKAIDKQAAKVRKLIQGWR